MKSCSLDSHPDSLAYSVDPDLGIQPTQEIQLRQNAGNRSNLGLHT